MKKNHLIAFFIATFFLAADQLQKWYMLTHVFHEDPNKIIPVTPFFNFVMVWNPGISFGLFGEAGSPLFFAALSSVIVIILLVWLFKTTSKLASISIGLLVGGAIGNIFDRFLYGKVADFFDVHFLGYHWPAFNIADSVVFTGALLLCIESIMEPKGDEPKEK